MGTGLSFEKKHLAYHREERRDAIMSHTGVLTRKMYESMQRVGQWKRMNMSERS